MQARYLSESRPTLSIRRYDMYLLCSLLQGLPDPHRDTVVDQLHSTIEAALTGGWLASHAHCLQYLEALGENFALGELALWKQFPLGEWLLAYVACYTVGLCSYLFKSLYCLFFWCSCAVLCVCHRVLSRSEHVSSSHRVSHNIDMLVYTHSR